MLAVTQKPWFISNVMNARLASTYPKKGGVCTNISTSLALACQKGDKSGAAECFSLCSHCSRHSVEAENSYLGRLSASASMAEFYVSCTPDTPNSRKSHLSSSIKFNELFL